MFINLAARLNLITRNVLVIWQL